MVCFLQHLPQSRLEFLQHRLAAEVIGDHVGGKLHILEVFESLTPLFEAMSVMMDYDTYWKDLMKNPRIKNPKLVFQSEVEKALLMPSAIIGEYTARKAQSDTGHTLHREYNWTKAFDEE